MGGFSTCDHCGQEEYRSELCYGCCEKGSDDYPAICESCSFSLAKNQVKCSECNVEFCARCGDLKKTDCCGLYLCTDCNESEEHDSEVVVADCGHETCGFFRKKGPCRSCVRNSKKQEEDKLMVKDLPHVEAMLAVVQSKTLKNYFGAFVAKVKTYPE
jgi:hypothetical protein